MILEWHRKFVVLVTSLHLGMIKMIAETAGDMKDPHTILNTLVLIMNIRTTDITTTGFSATRLEIASRQHILIRSSHDIVIHLERDNL